MAPARNRVTPTGDIVAIPLRGAWTGNRGIIHRGRDIARFHASDLWITCVLEFRGRKQEQWRPHHYTFLFFHDEAVSFAMNGNRGLLARRLDQAEHLAGFLVVPVLQVLHAVLVLRVEVTLVRTGDRVLRQARYVVVNVNEQRHPGPLALKWD